MKYCHSIVTGVVLLLSACLMSACNLSGAVISHNDFPDTMMRVQQELTQRGYQITRIQTLDQGLEKAGYEIDKYRILFFGNALDFDIIQERYPELTVFLPLSISVYEDDGEIYLQSMPYSMMKKASNDREYLAMVHRWQSDVDEAIHTAASPSPDEP
jgi:uncharacterized protein (DUF302 family)